jgi:hypothetical protein
VYADASAPPLSDITRMKPASGSAREGLLAATAPDVPVGMSPDVPLGTPPDIPMAMAIGQPQAPLAPEVMYREPVGFADGYSMQTLSAASGLVLRERVYLSQLCCAACEKKTSYAAGVLPENSSPEAYVDDNEMLSFLNPGAFEVREESECCCRYCCHQFRELKLGYFAPRVVGGQPGDGLWEGGLGGFGWPEGETPALLLERPFRCTVCCCCCLLNPQEMKVFDSGVSLGGALQEWDCCMVLWPYRRYAVVDEHGEKEMTVEVPLLCADGCRNCFAPSCCNQVFSMPIKPVGGGDAIGSLENHFPGCNCRGLCMAGGANNNYVVRFPRDASPHSKARLLSALHLIDFNFFERRGNQK